MSLGIPSKDYYWVRFLFLELPCWDCFPVLKLVVLLSVKTWTRRTRTVNLNRDKTCSDYYSKRLQSPIPIFHFFTQNTFCDILCHRNYCDEVLGPPFNIIILLLVLSQELKWTLSHQRRWVSSDLVFYEKTTGLLTFVRSHPRPYNRRPWVFTRTILSNTISG